MVEKILGVSYLGNNSQSTKKNEDYIIAVIGEKILFIRKYFYDLNIIFIKKVKIIRLSIIYGCCYIY